MKEKVYNAYMGFACGEALGLPVLFDSRKSLRNAPVTDMRGHGTFDQPAGTWSVGTSLLLCNTDSLMRTVDPSDLLENILRCTQGVRFCPSGEYIDVDAQIRLTVLRYASGTPALKCGDTSERANTNIALPLFFPLAFYLSPRVYANPLSSERAMEIITQTTAILQKHPRGLIGCVILTATIMALLAGLPYRPALQTSASQVLEYFDNRSDTCDQTEYWHNLRDVERLMARPEDEISSDAYIVHTLEAVFWCLGNSRQYEEAVFKAVNLGGNTTLIGALTGGLAGLVYGQQPPAPWLQTLAKRQELEAVCEKFNAYLKAHWHARLR
jgi:ADP-ribosyl-[dinitrogen reductase] hydrolase